MTETKQHPNFDAKGRGEKFCPTGQTIPEHSTLDDSGRFEGAKRLAHSSRQTCRKSGRCT